MKKKNSILLNGSITLNVLLQNKSQTKTVAFYKPTSAHLRLKNEKPVSADYAISSGKSIILFLVFLNKKKMLDGSLS